MRGRGRTRGRLGECKGRGGAWGKEEGLEAERENERKRGSTREREAGREDEGEREGKINNETQEKRE